MALFAGQVQTRPYESPDYGPSVVAAREYAMTGAQAIPNMIGQVGDYFKEQGNAKKSAQLGIKIAEAAKIMDPAQAPYYDNLIFSMKDENTPVAVRGALGASVQDLLKQNTSMRAVAVQEAQMGMRPAYFGGGKQSSYRIPTTSRAENIRGAVDMSLGDAALNAQPNQDMIPPSPEQLGVPGALPGSSVNFDLKQLNAGIEELGKLRNVPASENQQYIEDFTSAVVANNPQGAQRVLQTLARSVEEASKGYEVKKDQPPVTIQTPSGSFNALRTSGGDYINQSTGEIIDSQTGQPKKFSGVRYADPSDFERAQQIYEASMGGGLLPPIDGQPVEGQLPDNFDPQSSIGKPEERSRVRALQQEGQSRAMAQNIPQGSMPTEQSMAYGATKPAPQQKSAGMGWMAKESQQAARSKTTQNAAQEYEQLTTLNPYQQEIVNEAMIEASQSGMAPGSELANELKRNMLYNRAFVPTSLPKKGVRIVTPEDKKRQSVALVAQARQRVSDRVAAEELMSRFDNIQAILNHPDASQFFGQSIPEEKLNEIAKSQGGIYALYKNLKGQDLVQAMQNIKQRSGTAAQMSERETFALQAAVNEFDSAQDLKSAQKSLKEMAAATIRTGKKIGLDGMVFDYAVDDQGNKTKEFNTTKILNSYDEFTPIFKDEVEYSKKIERLKPVVEGQQPTATVPQAQPQTGQYQRTQPSYNPYTNSLNNLDKAFFNR